MRELDRRLSAVLAAIWTRLEQAPADRASPLRTPVLGTIGPGGACALRTVILRAVEPSARRVVCHTDRRSPKVAHIAAHPGVAWLFYDPRDRVQIRLAGPASVHIDDALAERQWRATPAVSRGDYAGAEPPGTPVGSPDDGARAGGGAPEQIERAARGSFAAVAGVVESIDWLELDPRGHTRARFAWRGAGWEGTFVVP